MSEGFPSSILFSPGVNLNTVVAPTVRLILIQYCHCNSRDYVLENRCRIICDWRRLLEIWDEVFQGHGYIH
jgi:hypothetical protein